MWLVIEAVQAFVLGTILALKSGYNAFACTISTEELKSRNKYPTYDDPCDLLHFFCRSTRSALVL